MLLIAKIRSFRERRIALPVNRDALVLDVGSGDKPSWRADVLLDGYPGQDHAVQRSGGRAARITRPLFRADAADMPFRDKAFDFVICSHVLEHVRDPGAVINELTRVAKAGYIEVPEAASSKIVDFPSHLWWCRLAEDGKDGPVLEFTAKTEAFFDREINDYLVRTGLDKKVTGLLNSHFHENVIALRWAGKVNYRVTGRVSESLLTSTQASVVTHATASTLAARVLTRLMIGARAHKPRRVRWDDLVKPEFRTGSDTYLQPRVYEIVGHGVTDGRPAPQG